jgi:hypothetical protein
VAKKTAMKQVKREEVKLKRLADLKFNAKGRQDDELASSSKLTKRAKMKRSALKQYETSSGSFEVDYSEESGYSKHQQSNSHYWI